MKFQSASSVRLPLQELDPNVAVCFQPEFVAAPEPVTPPNPQRSKKRPRPHKTVDVQKRGRKPKVDANLRPPPVKKIKTAEEMMNTKNFLEFASTSDIKKRRRADRRARYERIHARSVLKNQTPPTLLTPSPPERLESPPTRTSTHDMPAPPIYMSHDMPSLPMSHENNPAISNEDWNRIGDFYEALKCIKRETCDVCNEIGFELHCQPWENGFECARCRRLRLKNPDMVPLYGTANMMDPLALPSHLPPVSIAEELLIARAHVYMDLRRVKGCQYKYSGHIVSFMQNTAKIIHKLPSLPSELQMLILKPASSAARNSAVSMTFRETFRVRRKHVSTWLEFLIQHHPDYRGIRIDQNNLSQLPENDSVWNQLPSVNDPSDVDVQKNVSLGAANAVPIEEEEEENLIETACVPDLTTDVNELNRLKEQICSIPVPVPVSNEIIIPFSMASMESEALNEFDSLMHIERMAFPSLFPTGAASFDTPRLKTVGFSEYVTHLLRYRDERFARHPQF